MANIAVFHTAARGSIPRTGISFSFFLQKIIDLKHYFSIIFILLYFLGWRWSNSSRASSPSSERCCRLVIVCVLLKGGIRTLYIWTTQLDPPCPTMNTSELPSIFPSSILTPTVALTWLTIHWTWKWAMLLLALRSSRFPPTLSCLWKSLKPDFVYHQSEFYTKLDEDFDDEIPPDT